MSDVLILIRGIDEYDSGLHNLAGITKDYNDVIHTFVKYQKYKVLHETSDMNVVYSNYKLNLTLNGIELFVEQAHIMVIEIRYV